MTAATLVESQTTRPRLASLRSLVGSKFGLRVIGIFVISALIPLALAGFVMLREFGTLLGDRERRDLDGLVRSYGMSLVGRLNSADDIVEGLVVASQRSTDNRWIDDQLRQFEWVRSVRRLSPDNVSVPPSLTGSQDLALARHQSVIVVEPGSFNGSGMAISLVRKLPGGELLQVEFSPGWLWSDLAELSDDATLLLNDAANRTLVIDGIHAGQLDDSALRDERSEWLVSRWELFLGGRFNSASWQVIGFKPSPSVIAGMHGTRVLFPAIVVLTLLVVCLISLRLIRSQLRPLERLVEGTKQVARLDFSKPVEFSGSDEFADLARSFNGMSSRLRTQFSALETLAEIDRLLLHSRGLESILDSVLPRIAGVLGSCTVSVLLSDPDAADHGRSYDYLAILDQRLPVRRLTTDVTALRIATAERPNIDISATDLRAQTYLHPMTEAGAKRFRICTLRHEDGIRGYLCAGFDGAPANSNVRIDDFADRLSVVLANLGRAEKLYEQAHFDPLTGLPNRQHFREELAKTLAQYAEAPEGGALLYIDLDHFKWVNDTAGHTTGDELLCAVARRLGSCLDPGDLVARLGGDEFAAIIRRARNGDEVRQVVQKILDRLQRPLILGGREFRVQASIGITLFPADGRTIEDLLKNSDIAMYRAKESGRGQAVFFETEMQDRMLARAALETGMRRALEREEFTLHFQPIFESADCRLAGVEALIRWPSAPGGEPLSPSVFMPLAEESDLVIGIGQWVLRTACRQFKAWEKLGARIGYVSVNVSSRQLRQPQFVEMVLNCLSVWRMQPGELCLEITEGVLAGGASIASTLEQLAARGVHLALDDFGTGYSSLSYLRTFPIHSVKIDRSFVTEIPQSPAACRLVESIIAMSAVLGKETVAEGVETEEQRLFLQSAGCGAIQGYLLGRPMEADKIPEFLRRNGAEMRTAIESLPARRFRTS